MPVGTGTGVLTTVPSPDVEPGAALLPRVRREDPLHCGGGCVFFDGAPLPGNASADIACVVKGYTPSYDWCAILLRPGVYVRDGGEHQCY